MNAPFLGLPHIPAMERLMKRPQWVGWKRDGKKKPPVNVHTGQIDNGLSPSSQGTYDEALARVKRDRLPGLGFVMSGDDELTAIDLDDCLGEEALPDRAALAAEILAYAETYCERSPSGTSLRLFVDGKVAAGIPRADIGIEAFRADQFVTVTGAHVNGTPLAIQPAPKTFALLMERAGAGKNTDQGGLRPPRGRAGALAQQTKPSGATSTRPPSPTSTPSGGGFGTTSPRRA